MSIFEKYGIDAGVLAIAELVCIAVLFILFIVLLMLFRRMNSKYDRFMSGADGKSLEASLMLKAEAIDGLSRGATATADDIARIQDQLTGAVQKRALQKYNAFDGMGGKQSFSICLLDGKNTGFILSSIFNREGCNVYLKEVIRGEAYVLLSDEEKGVLAQAKQNLLDLSVEEDDSDQ